MTNEQALEMATGRVIDLVKGAEPGSEEVEISFVDGSTLRFYHEQDCCESVRLEEVHGSPRLTTGATVHKAQESTNSDDQPDYADSWTWTFYRIITDKETLVLRWLGESNGYYGEEVSVEFKEL